MRSLEKKKNIAPNVSGRGYFFGFAPKNPAILYALSQFLNTRDFELIADGAMTGTVKQDADGMAAAISQTAAAVAGGKAPAEALGGLSDARFTIAGDCASKLFVAYAPYTGE